MPFLSTFAPEFSATNLAGSIVRSFTIFGATSFVFNTPKTYASFSPMVRIIRFSDFSFSVHAAQSVKPLVTFAVKSYSVLSSLSVYQPAKSKSSFVGAVGSLIAAFLGTV